jgi:hypothetical protein
MAIAKRKLKAPDEPIQRKSPAELALAEKKLELTTLKDRHKLAVVAQRENEQSNGAMSKRDPGLAVEKRKLEYKIARASDETALLDSLARLERGKRPEAAGEWRSAQRRRALTVLALRAANKEIAGLRKDGLSGPCDLTVGPTGFIAWDHLLLGHSGNVGVNGQQARAYLQACQQAGIITTAELREDEDAG